MISLKKLEAILAETGYTLRYEKGRFVSGSCVIQDQKVVVVNKFFKPEDRQQILSDLIPDLEIDINSLSKESHKCLQELQSRKSAQ